MPGPGDRGPHDGPHRDEPRRDHGGPHGGRPHDGPRRDARPRNEPPRKRNAKPRKKKVFNEDNAVKVYGTFSGFGAAPETKLKKAMKKVGSWIVSEVGTMSGHVRAVVTNHSGREIRYDLGSMDRGVVKTGKFGATDDTVEFRLMCICRKVDEDDLMQVLIGAIEDSGLDYQWASEDEDDWEEEEESADDWEDEEESEDDWSEEDDWDDEDEDSDDEWSEEDEEE